MQFLFFKQHLGEASFNRISEIYVKAVSSIEEPKNLRKIILEINKLDWYDKSKKELGDLYEGLLVKNADEKKSGAGQYFTPRVLIDVMTELIAPKFEDSCFEIIILILIQRIEKLKSILMRCNSPLAV